MEITVVGADGRSDASIAALVVANTLHVLGERVVIARYAGGVPVLNLLKVTGVDVVEPTAVRDFASLVDGARSLARSRSAHLVLDLPLEAVGETKGADARLLAVGPLATHVAAAAAVLRSDADPAGLHVLGCCRGNAKVDSAALRLGLLGHNVPTASVLPTSLPRPTDGEAIDLLRGRIAGRMLRAGICLLGDLDAIEPDGEALAIAETQTDTRSGADRLRELADAIEMAMEGKTPTAEELSLAPRLENWHRAQRPVPVLVGTVSGHPNIASGRPVVTSELHLTDGKTFARTISRLYRLGRAADDPLSPTRH